MNSKVDFAAGGIVFYNNLIVIVKNKRHGEDSDNSFWGYPKGHLEDGEKPSDAALREVYEETGFKVKLANDTPIAESRYEITLENEVINKTVFNFQSSYTSETDDCQNYGQGKNNIAVPISCPGQKMSNRFSLSFVYNCSRSVEDHQYSR